MRLSIQEEPANCGFEANWSDMLRTRHAGAPLKRIAAWLDEGAAAITGECVISAYGLEGSLIYALSGPIRERIARDELGASMIVPRHSRYW